MKMCIGLISLRKKVLLKLGKLFWRTNRLWQKRSGRVRASVTVQRAMAEFLYNKYLRWFWLLLNRILELLDGG